MKKESPVIANQTSRGEQVLGFCTNRPSRSGSGFAIRVADGILSAYGADVRGSGTWVGSRLERSRNKVVARERVAGTLIFLIRRTCVHSPSNGYVNPPRSSVMETYWAHDPKSAVRSGPPR